jgi:hypothetical protein
MRYIKALKGLRKAIAKEKDKKEKEATKKQRKEKR